MQSSLQESTTRLQHAVDEIKEFRAGIWTLRDGLLLEVEVNSRRGANNKGQWKLYPASTHWKIFRAPATNPVQWCCQTGCPLNGIPQAFEQLSAVLDRCTP